MYSDLSFVSFLTVCAVVFIYMRLAVVVTTSVSSSNNNNYIPFAGHLQSHIISQRSAFAALYRLQRGGSYFRLGSIRTWEEHPQKKKTSDAKRNIPSNIIRHEATRRADNDQRKATCQTLFL
jgi:hypothetical protein